MTDNKKRIDNDFNDDHLPSEADTADKAEVPKEDIEDWISAWNQSKQAEDSADKDENRSWKERRFGHNLLEDNKEDDEEDSQADDEAKPAWSAKDSHEAGNGFAAFEFEEWREAVAEGRGSENKVVIEGAVVPKLSKIDWAEVKE